jgi:uncharacterized protein with HEPN domain
MKPPDDRLRLVHMLEHAREAVALAGGKTRVDLGSDRLLELALVRLVEVVGEAASHVSDETRARHPQIPWRAITSMRHRLAHGYDAVDLDILWNTIDEDLRPLIGQLEAALDMPGAE